MDKRQVTKDREIILHTIWKSSAIIHRISVGSDLFCG